MLEGGGVGMAMCATLSNKKIASILLFEVQDG
jgi:hypothetical protein